MNLTMEQSQENIKQWLQGPENIYNYNVLTYPSIEQQAYILEQHQLREQFKKYQNQQDLQKNLLPYCDQHKAIIYVMFLIPKYQRILFDLMNIKGFHNILAFYQEFNFFINTQFHLLKDNLKSEIFPIMKLFLENPLEQLEECFKSFLRIGVIYPDPKNIEFLFVFLKFLLEQNSQIISKPNLAALLFYKYILILNVEDFYRMQKFPIKEINKIIIEIWQLYQTQILTFGRELLINLQVPISYSEISPPYLDLTLIKQSLVSAHLIGDMTTTMQSYKANYQLLLPFEIEQRVAFAVFSQSNVESVQTSLILIFEKYGYHLNFIGAIVRHLVCMYQFDDGEIKQNKIAVALFLIYEIAELKGDKWPIYLRYIFSDIFLMTKDLKNDHHILSGLYFLSYLHKRQIYDELQSALWFIFQTFESNDQLKRKVQPQLLQFSSHLLFQKLIEDPRINEVIKCKIHEYFLKLLCTQFQGPDGLSYQQQQSAIYSVDDLDTPLVIPNDKHTQQQQPDDLDLYDIMKSSNQTPQMSVEDSDLDSNHYLDVDIFVQKILEKEKLDIIFMNPHQEQNLIKLLTFFNKQVQLDVKQLFITELTKIILKLYEDQFYDIQYEYEFNCLQTLLKINFTQDSLLFEIFQNIIKQEPFCLNYLFLIQFEQKIVSSNLEKLIFSSLEQLLKSYKMMNQLISQQRINNILEQLIQTPQINSNIEFTLNLLLISNIQSIQKISHKIKFLFIKNYLYIVHLLKIIAASETNNVQGFLVEIAINIIMQEYIKIVRENENLKDMNIILELVLENLEIQNKKFWLSFQQVFQNLLQYKRITEECLVQFYAQCINFAQLQVEGVCEIFLITPNTMKSLIFKSLYKFLDKARNTEAVETILKHLSKDQRGFNFKNSLQLNLENYLKLEKK